MVAHTYLTAAQATDHANTWDLAPGIPALSLVVVGSIILALVLFALFVYYILLVNACLVIVLTCC